MAREQIELIDWQKMSGVLLSIAMNGRKFYTDMQEQMKRSSQRTTTAQLTGNNVPAVAID